MPRNAASLNQIAYNLLNTMRGGRTSHTEHLSLGQIKFAIKYYRALFIRRDFERNSNRFRLFEQDLGAVDVSLYDTAEDTVEESLEEVLRTDDIIPAPVRLKNWEGITFVGGIDKQGRPIPLIDGNRSYWQQFNKYTKTQPEAYYRNGYVYINNATDLDIINIRGVFEDPEEVFNFTAANGLDLYNPDSAFPIPMDMLQRITQGLINGELSVVVQTPDDDELDRKQTP